MTSRSGSWSLGAEQVHAADRLLGRFLARVGARCALLIGRSGQLITRVGEEPAFDVTAFSALATADFAANAQLASLLGDRDFRALHHEGEQESIFLAEVAAVGILVVLFERRIPLGRIRFHARPLVAEFAELLRRPGAEHAEARLEHAWITEAEHQIDRFLSPR